MTSFQSKTTINKPINEVYAFLADFNNHQQLMPENIVDWVSTYDNANFNIQNMAKLSLKIDERVENSLVKIIATEKPPFDVILTWHLSPTEDSTDVTFTISADLNMMMKMLASGPLQKLADHEALALSKSL